MLVLGFEKWNPTAQTLNDLEEIFSEKKHHAFQAFEKDRDVLVSRTDLF
jgi:hypothetical protein